MDFTQSIDNGYMIPTSVAVGSGEATDIRCVCDTVEDFKAFLDTTGMDLKYEGLVTYEKVNKRLMVYEGNNNWKVVGEGGGSVDTSNFITLTQLSQQLGNYYTKTQTDSKISALNEEMENIKNNNSSNYVPAIEPLEDDIPKVFFDGDIDGMTKNNSKILKILYKSKTQAISKYVKMKWQGSSSIAYPKKNFTITMYEDADCTIKYKHDFRQWGKQSKYCLKANYVDHSHARNVVGAKIWNDIVSSRADYDALPTELKESPNNGAIDGFPIKLYMNGKYEGLYTFNIPKDGWLFNMDEDNENHGAICGELNDGINCTFRQLPKFTNDWGVEFPDVLSDKIKNSFTQAVSFVMNSSDDEFKRNLGNYFDVTSLLDYYIYCYAGCFLDQLARNMMLVTYDGVHFIASMYDMDSTWGLFPNGNYFVAEDYMCPEDYQEKNSLLWEKLERCFAKELYYRYTELRAGALSVSNIIDTFERFTDCISRDLYLEDCEIYTEIPSQLTNNIKQIRNYATNRLSYTDTQFYNMSIDPIPVEAITINSDISLETGQIFNISVDYSPSNTTEKDVVWSSDNNQVATVENGKVAALSPGDCIITCTSKHNDSIKATCQVTVSQGELVDDGILNEGVVLKLTKNSIGTDGWMDSITNTNYLYVNNVSKKENTVSFKGGHIEIPSEKFDVSQDFTVQIKGSWNQGSWSKMIGTEGVTDKVSTFSIGVATTENTVYITSDTNTVNYNFGTLVSGKEFVVTVVKSNNTIDIYLDKEKVNTFENIKMSKVNRNVFIGKNGENDNGKWNGDMSCVLIYNVALSESQILSNIDNM